MKITEMLTASGIVPSSSFKGEAKTNAFILAVDTTGEAENAADYDVAAVHISGLGASIDASTEDSNYLYEGKFTTRIDTRRTFSIAGKRIVGDAFQDWACSHAIKFGTGNDVVRKYIYFNVLTGNGEQGTLTFNVKSDGSGDSGNTADISIEAFSNGTPEEFTYSAS